MKQEILKILVIDDDPASLALVRATLRQANYLNVDLFENPLEAQRAYQTTQYDILILDLRMPVLSGFEILEEMQAIHNKRPRTIVLTAQVEEDTAQKAMDLGAKKVLFKPYNVKDLVKEVATQIEALEYTH